MAVAADVATYAACSLAILWSGSHLTRHADAIAGATGFGRTWAGFLLLATVTSLPEAATGITAAWLRLPNIAAGDVLGSMLVNLVILASLDLRAGAATLWAHLSTGHRRPVASAMYLVAAVGVAILLGARLPAIGPVGPVTLLLLLAYPLVARKMRPPPLADTVRDQPLGALAVRFGVHALVVVAAGLLLPRAAQGIALASGLGNAFVGTTFVALTTSLPEIVVTLAAVRIGAWDLAAADLLGSNLFDLFLLGVDDLVYRPAPILHDIETVHVATATAILGASGLALWGLSGAVPRRRWLLSAPSWGIVALALANAALLARLGH